jgi:hypothetical protein
MDFTEKYYWFGVVDIGLAQLTGIVEGLKLGPAQCTGTLFGLIFMLAAFLIFIFWRRPYNSPFASVFSVITTFLQVVGACFLAAWMYGGSASYQELAEQTTLISLYLLVGKAVLDIIPKARRIVEFFLGLAKKRRATPKNNNMDLSERLLEVVQQDEELQLKDHSHVVTAEVANAHIDAELPEQDDDDDFLLGPPPLDDGDDDLPLPSEPSLDFGGADTKHQKKKRPTLADLNPLAVDDGTGDDDDEDAESRQRRRQLKVALYGEDFGSGVFFGATGGAATAEQHQASDENDFTFDIDSILPPPVPAASASPSSAAATTAVLPPLPHVSVVAPSGTLPQHPSFFLLVQGLEPHLTTLIAIPVAAGVPPAEQRCPH